VEQVGDDNIIKNEITWEELLEQHQRPDKSMERKEDGNNWEDSNLMFDDSGKYYEGYPMSVLGFSANDVYLWKKRQTPQIVQINQLNTFWDKSTAAQ
jgi:hypothetical protein